MNAIPKWLFIPASILSNLLIILILPYAYSIISYGMGILTFFYIEGIICGIGTALYCVTTSFLIMNTLKIVKFSIAGRVMFAATCLATHVIAIFPTASKLLRGDYVEGDGTRALFIIYILSMIYIAATAFIINKQIKNKQIKNKQIKSFLFLKSENGDIMKAITMVFYILVLIILSTGVYFYSVNNRYTYQHNAHIRVDNSSGKVQYYNDNSQAWSDAQ